MTSSRHGVGPRPRTTRKESRSPSAAPISFAFIDGNHTYDFVRRDFEGIDRHLEIGGFVLFDDSSDSGGFEVNRLMKEVEALPRYDLVAKNPNYLFRKVAES